MKRSMYEALIRSLCSEACIEDWASVVDRQHLLVDRQVVGLLHDEDDPYGSELAVHVEHDDVLPAQRPDLCVRLLQANLHRDEGLFGTFSIHRDSGHAVYSMQVQVGPELSASSLLDLVVDQVRASRDALQSMQA